MPIQTPSDHQGVGASTRKVICKRSHPRFSVEAQVALARAGISKRIIVRNKDLSWGGAGLLVPREALQVDESVVLKFPWLRGGSFSARGEVAWNHQVDDHHRLVGVSFSRLLVCDEERLFGLLSMLTQSGHMNEIGIPVADGLEIRFLDGAEMLAALEQIRLGWMETTAFQSFQANERMRLVLTGFSDLPTLHLRARVLWQKAFCHEENPRVPGLFQVALVLDHPADDLKRVTDPLIKRLRR